MSENTRNKKLINIFESIPKFMVYSQYDKSLDRQFYKRNLKDLLTDLKRPKYRRKISALENIISKYPYELYSKMDENKKERNISLPSLTKEYLKPFLSKKTETNNQINNNNSIDSSIFSNKSYLRNKIKKNNTTLNDNVDPFKYNLNYNSIYKNIRSFKIHEPTPRNNKNSEDKNLELEEKKKKNNSKIYLKKLQNSENVQNKNYENTKSRNYPLLTSITDKTNNKTIINSFRDKNNHAMQFCLYSGRKDNILKQNDNISYIEPYNILKDQKKNVNFKKMLSRNDLNLSDKNAMNIPTICYYNPNYNYLRHIPKIIIDSSSISKECKTKKYALQKILRKYDIKKEYEIVDNSKIIDKLDINI